MRGLWICLLPLGYTLSAATAPVAHGEILCAWGEVRCASVATVPLADDYGEVHCVEPPHHDVIESAEPKTSGTTSMAAENPTEMKARTTPRQMALALFEDMFDLGTSISEANREIGYQRNNFFTEIVNMGLAARRFLDAAYFIVAQEPEAVDQYDVELNYFKWLMRYDSRNLKHLRTIADEAQNAKVRVTNTPSDREPAEDDIWVQVQLIGMVAMHRGRIRFDVHHSLIPHIRDPRKSHWLSLRISTAFTRSLARAIYDKVLPSVPAGRTDWIKLDEMRTWPGKMGANASIFKYFKRDWLEPQSGKSTKSPTLNCPTRPGRNRRHRRRWTVSGSSSSVKIPPMQ